ncbi:6498_t:CDS:1 [Acaulospora colombiana]|uniref:6498_t:CDS:1 n=1 Tax=Acaulospora colombiana TaxID=27376 RepID=A0ACA9KRN7_9GLOM|nr:6498_t:CDS:1 [Acaulospora colombiana]
MSRYNMQQTSMRSDELTCISSLPPRQTTGGIKYFLHITVVKISLVDRLFGEDNNTQHKNLSLPTFRPNVQTQWPPIGGNEEDDSPIFLQLSPIYYVVLHNDENNKSFERLLHKVRPQHSYYLPPPSVASTNSRQYTSTITYAVRTSATNLLSYFKNIGGGLYLNITSSNVNCNTASKFDHESTNEKILGYSKIKNLTTLILNHPRPFMKTYPIWANDSFANAINLHGNPNSFGSGRNVKIGEIKVHIELEEYANSRSHIDATIINYDVRSSSSMPGSKATISTETNLSFDTVQPKIRSKVSRNVPAILKRSKANKSLVSMKKTGDENSNPELNKKKFTDNFDNNGAVNKDNSKPICISNFPENSNITSRDNSHSCLKQFDDNTDEKNSMKAIYNKNSTENSSSKSCETLLCREELTSALNITVPKNPMLRDIMERALRLYKGQ